MATLTTLDVEALCEGLSQAWNRGDPDGVADAYAADGRLYTPFGDAFDGQDAVREAYRLYFGTLLAGTQTAISVGPVRSLGCDLFMVDATQSITAFPNLHLTMVVRHNGAAAEIVEARPFVFLPKP